MFWIEQLLKIITTQPNSDNMKYSFKTGITFLYSFLAPSYSKHYQKSWKDRQCIMGYQASSQTQTHGYTVIFLLQYVTRCLYLPHDIQTLHQTDSNVIPVDLPVQYVQLSTLFKR